MTDPYRGMSASPQPIRNPDSELERRIDAARARFAASPSPINWRSLTDLVQQRSPGQVSRMERERGLR